MFFNSSHLQRRETTIDWLQNQVEVLLASQLLQFFLLHTVSALSVIRLTVSFNSITSFPSVLSSLHFSHFVLLCYNTLAHCLFFEAYSTNTFHTQVHNVFFSKRTLQIHFTPKSTDHKSWKNSLLLSSKIMSLLKTSSQSCTEYTFTTTSRLTKTYRADLLHWIPVQVTPCQAVTFTKLILLVSRWTEFTDDGRITPDSPKPVPKHFLKIPRILSFVPVYRLGNNFSVHTNTSPVLSQAQRDYFYLSKSPLSTPDWGQNQTTQNYKSQLRASVSHEGLLLVCAKYLPARTTLYFLNTTHTLSHCYTWLNTVIFHNT